MMGLSMLALANLAGCATDVENEAEGSDDPVVAKPQDESTNLAPDQTSTGLTGPCTTSTTCDANYCCTTEDCKFTTTITCRPRVTTTKLSAFTLQ